MCMCMLYFSSCTFSRSIKCVLVLYCMWCVYMYMYICVCRCESFYFTFYLFNVPCLFICIPYYMYVMLLLCLFNFCMLYVLFYYLMCTNTLYVLIILLFCIPELYLSPSLTWNSQLFCSQICLTSLDWMAV